MTSNTFVSLQKSFIEDDERRQSATEAATQSESNSNHGNLMINIEIIRDRKVSNLSESSKLSFELNEEHASNISTSCLDDHLRLSRCSSLSSVTIPIELRADSNISTIQSEYYNQSIRTSSSVSNARIVKLTSKTKPQIMQGKRVFVPRRGYGRVLFVKKRLGRATLFSIDFDIHGVQTLRLARKPGQKGEIFYVRDVP